MKTCKSVRPFRRTALVVAIAGAFALLSSTAMAQETPADTPPDQSESEDAITFDRIIVTANKRVENVREVASSISVISAEQLDNLNATQLNDFAAYVPGLQVTAQGTPGKTSITLRGISPISTGATVSTYIDETPVGSSGIYQSANGLALDLLPYDISRVEVLRGPQGTLYGAGSMGGLLKYVTRDPDLSNREFRIGGGVSDVERAGDPGWNARFGANLPLIEDGLAVRLSYARNEIPGFIDNVADGRRDINDGTQESARVALLWQASDDVSLKLNAMRQTIDSDNNAIVALDTTTQRPLFGDSTNTVFVDEPFNKEIDFFAATLEWDLGWADFTSASGYSDASTFLRLDATQIFGEFATLFGLPSGSVFVDQNLDIKKYTQEFRLTSNDTGPFEWQVGAFYTREEADNTQFFGLRQLDGTPLPPPFDSIAGTLVDAEIPSDYKETAVFANGSYQFNDRFELGAGVRFARNDQEFTQIVRGGLLLPIGVSPNSSSEDVFTWSLSPKFQLTDDAMLYARVATGYAPGGPNVVAPGLPPVVDSSTLTSYEVGLKSELVDRRLLLDLAIFRIDWEDIQIGTVSNNVSGLVNGGEATSQGVELSTAFKLTRNLRLGLNAAYTDATLNKDTLPVVIPVPGAVVTVNSGLAGDRLPFVPVWSSSATADYYFPLGGDWNGHVGGGFRWVGARTVGTTSRQVVTLPTVPPTVIATTVTPPLNLDNYRALDLYADVSNANWTIRAYMRNVTDERAYLVINPVTSAVTGVTDHLAAATIQPRTFGLEVDYRF